MAPKSGKKTGKLVVRGGSKQKKAPTKPVPKLPFDWSVSSAPPTYAPQNSALEPSALLQEKCSGHDIQLARNAAAPAIAEKEKGKFLLIFPGQFSFHKKPQASELKTPPKKTAENAEKVPNSKEDGNDDSSIGVLTIEDDSDDASAKNGKDAKEPRSKLSTNLPTVGSLEGVRTEAPTFKIPFHDQNKLLVFPGKKVATTSKFIMLSCANKQKMAVNCKVSNCFNLCSHDELASCFPHSSFCVFRSFSRRPLSLGHPSGKQWAA